MRTYGELYTYTCMNTCTGADKAINAIDPCSLLTFLVSCATRKEQHSFKHNRGLLINTCRQQASSTWESVIAGPLPVSGYLMLSGHVS